jgi:hypothetical protein
VRAVRKGCGEAAMTRRGQDSLSTLSPAHGAFFPLDNAPCDPSPFYWQGFQDWRWHTGRALGVNHCGFRQDFMQKE